MELKIGCEESALGEMCSEGMGTVPKGRFRCLHYVKCVLRAFRDLQRGFQVLALAKIWGQMQRGFEVLPLCNLCFEGMRAVENRVSRVGSG